MELEFTLDHREMELASSVSVYLGEQAHVESELAQALIRISLNSHKRNSGISKSEEMSSYIKNDLLEKFGQESGLLRSPYFDLIANVAPAIYTFEQKQLSIKGVVIQVIKQVSADMPRVLQEMKDLAEFNEKEGA